MALQNPWVTYVDRSYKSIKTSIVNRMKSVVPEVTDLSESNIFIIIAGLFAGLVEQLNYYIDNVAREMYITTARRYSSMIKLTRLIDYRVRAKIGSTVDIKVTALDGNGDPFNLTADYTFNSGIIVNTPDGVKFVTQRKATIFKGTSSVVIGARQGELVSNENLGTATSDQNQYFALNESYRHDSLQIIINSITWEFRNTLAFSGPQDKHFIVQVNESKQSFVVFGNGINGAIPPSGQTIYGTYYKCLGISGNVDADTINSFDSSTEPTPPVNVASFLITNELPAVGGLEVEDLERIRRNAPLSIRTLGRAVTEQDYRDIAMLVPGVGKSSVSFDKQLKKVSIYVCPEEGGTASLQLLQDVEDYFDDKKMISTFILAQAAGETKLRIKLTATAKFRRDTTQTRSDIISSLKTNYGFNGSKINKSIRRSDIIALIDGLDKVDYLSLDKLTTKPYPRITNGSSQLEANWVIEVNESNTRVVEWRLSVIDSVTARLYYKDIDGIEIADGDVTIHDTEQSDPDYTSQNGYISIAVWGTFTIGDTWIFNSYEYNKDIQVSDNTIPIFDEAELDLTVNEQLILE